MNDGPPFPPNGAGLPTRDFLVGIGGGGMRPLALLLVAEERQVAGSDRALDAARGIQRFEELRGHGIELYPQDGSGPRPGDRLILSSSIEKTNPDVVRARQLALPVVHRSEALAELFGRRQGIAIAGTSGKSTVTAMLGYLLFHLGCDPSLMCGAEVYGIGDRAAAALAGGGDLFVIEADESDGSFLRYDPVMGVVTNISKDHQPLSVLMDLFQQFARRCQDVVILGGDCPRAASLDGTRRHLFGITQGDTAANSLELSAAGSRFSVAGVSFHLPVPGLYNVQNALAAIAVCRELGIDLLSVADLLSGFRGLSRRLELVGTAEGVEVYDDYAHNPHKIAAVLQATEGGPRWIIFQPHGYGPTRFLLAELADALSQGVQTPDQLILLPIFDAGGTADRTISSKDLATAVRDLGAPEPAVMDRPELLAFLSAQARSGDRVLFLGARDPTLSDLARTLVTALGQRARNSHS